MPLGGDLLQILDAHNVTQDVKLILRRCRLTTPQLLGMVKTEERLDSDVISNIQWDCEKIDEDSDHVKKTAMSRRRRRLTSAISRRRHLPYLGLAARKP